MSWHGFLLKNSKVILKLLKHIKEVLKAFVKVKEVLLDLL